MLTFEELTKLLSPYELVQVETGDGKRNEFVFRRRRLPTGKRNLLTKVMELKEGGLTGYIYVGHLSEYDKHPERKKMGYLPIRHLGEHELKDLLQKVTKGYR